MDLEIVFNELSLQTRAADISTAREWMSEFIDTIRTAKPAPGIKRKLRTRNDFSDSLLAPNSGRTHLNLMLAEYGILENNY